MLKSHERFHSVNGKRQILIADDEFINRELLRAILQDTYELVFATNGQEALEAARANKDTLSLILLDLMMPVMGGMDMLREAKADPDISEIPVIVISADQGSEIESLTIGATDFIPKPYPEPGVIHARILRTIELSEDRQIINSTERDTLTGLYNREYFYRYAEQFDQYHKDVDMDAIVVDVNHFHMINERFGTSYGDSVLRRIGESLRSTVLESGGIVCRREADTFMVYCPHRTDYEEMLDQASMSVSSDADDNSRIWLRMGVYPHADKSLEIERRFDRAKMATDSVKGSFTRRIGTYDSTLHERELFSEQLIEQFDTAVRERQFQVFFQPKFDVQTEIPVLASAEALVRWQHPELGLISPGVFIPLFEDNGLIQQLDLFVWRETAARIRDWKDRLGFSVPVSVNVSRIDMYDPHLIDTLRTILSDTGLTPSDLFLEITESAYTQDSEQIIEIVCHLRDLGFRVEMDDFGTGYSSLNMISTLPIDALKLDMQFIRNAFSESRDTRMIEVIIDIASYLNVPVIAEGVETEEQMRALRDMGCDYVQGYYFSRPVPAGEYEQFIVERRGLGEDSLRARARQIAAQAEDKTSLGDITHALTSGFELIYYIDTISESYVKFSPHGRREDLQIESSGEGFFDEVINQLLDTVHPEDNARVRLSLQKDALLSQLMGTTPFLITYRMLVDGRPVYYTLKAARTNTHDGHHIVIGISNVDAQIREAEKRPASSEPDFNALARALSADMEDVYYVDAETNTYQQYSMSTSHADLELNASGSDFFDDCRRGIETLVHPEDRDKLRRALSKHQLLQTLERQPVFTMIYRSVAGNPPLYHRLRATMSRDAGRHHVIMGVSSIDARSGDEERLEEERQDALTYRHIVHALALDYFRIYYVDTKTDHFTEYSSQEQHMELDIEQSGEDFFAESHVNARRLLHPDDVDMFLAAFTKRNVLSALDRDRTFTLTYRLMMGGSPTYVHLKATRMYDRKDPHIVIGVSNVDDQMRREQEHARALRMANQDTLTGVKSKHAYDAEERRADFAILANEQQPFAVAVCDVNGLRQINDTRGHATGDQFLKDACMIVCNVFKHSPVYRVGGDEFVAILRGADYRDRDDLMRRLDRANEVSAQTGGVTVAGGIATWDPAMDATMESVFARADAAMYENKKRAKEQQS